MKLKLSDFAVRMREACEKAEGVPELNFGKGRLSFLQQQLEAQGISVSLQSVSRWYNGVAVPRDTPLVALAHILGVTPEWLRFGASPKSSLPNPQSAEKNAMDTEEHQHVFRLRDNYEVTLRLPKDLEQDEALRLARFVSSLPIG